MSSTTKGIVLVTGVTGFVGTEVALAFLKAGYTVKGTVRSSSKAAEWIAMFPQHKDQFQYAIVQDIAASGAFDEAVKGCDIIAHTASPYTYKIEDNERDMLIPAINGTKNILEATKLEPKIKRVVLTSSFAAVCDVLDLPSLGRTYTPESWNPATYEEAKVATHPGFIYCASKGLAEHAFWDYIKTEKPTWSGSSLCPPMVYGPPNQKITSLSSLNTSIEEIYQAIDGTWKKNGIPPTGFPVFCDVRDLALAHVRAVELDAAKGQRYLFVEGHFKYEQVVGIAATFHPELSDRLPEVDVAAVRLDDHFQTDSSKTEKELGIVFPTFETTIKDTIDKLLELEKALGK